jgi:hypothetical protein
METIQPLPKRILNRAKELGITRIVLNFSGGSDEGYLTVDLEGGTYDNKFADQVEAWAWDVYAYNGAGCGEDYGDDITYDLAKGKASVSEWRMERYDSDSSEIPLVVDDEDGDEKA